MGERVFLVHGWSVRETTTYQALHLKLAEKGFKLNDVHLGRYVSLDDKVCIEDLARGLQKALVERLGISQWSGPFHIITHSTGALIVKEWLARHYSGKFSSGNPLRNVVFLAGPHFGSRLAHHGRSMLAHAAFGGDTGNRILESLELGSAFSWGNNSFFMDKTGWKDKEINLFCLAGDRVVKNVLKAAILPAGYEKGSDMTVRAASANLNFSRYILDGRSGKMIKIGSVSGVSYSVLGDYTHSGDSHGIMNSITKAADPVSPKWLNLNLILACLKVKDKTSLKKARKLLNEATLETRKKRQPFCQLDLDFRDEDGQPVSDYSVAILTRKGNKVTPSKAFEHLHKNQITPSHLTIFLKYPPVEEGETMIIRTNFDSGTTLSKYRPNPVEKEIDASLMKDFLVIDRTTQLEVIVGREPEPGLFAFHGGDEQDLHVKWNRRGEITDTKLPVK